MTYDSVFSGLADFSLRDKPIRSRGSLRSKNHPKDVIAVIDTLAGRFVAEVKQGMEMVIRGQLVPLLPDIRKKDKGVIAKVESIKWNNLLYQPIYNGLWQLWNRGFSQGVIAGLKELRGDSLSNYEEANATKLAEFANDKDKKKQELISRLQEERRRSKSSDYIDQQIRKYKAKESNLGRSDDDISREVRNKLALEDLGREKRLAELVPNDKGEVQKKYIRRRYTQEEIAQNKAKRLEEFRNPRKRPPIIEGQPPLPDLPPESERQRKRASPQEIKLREKANKETHLTKEAFVSMGLPQKALLEETKFGETYLEKRNGYIAKNHILQDDEVVSRIPRNAVAEYIGSTKMGRENILFDKITDSLFTPSKAKQATVDAVKARVDRDLKNKYGNKVSVVAIEKGGVKKETVLKELEETQASVARTIADYKNRATDLEDEEASISLRLKKLNRAKSLTSSELLEKRQKEVRQRTINLELKNTRGTLSNLEKEERDNLSAKKESNKLLDRNSKAIDLTEEEAKTLGLGKKVSLMDLNNTVVVEKDKEKRLNRLFKIASTEVVHAYNLGRLTSYKANGITEVKWNADAEHLNNAKANAGKKGKQIITPYACKICAERDGEQYAIDEILGILREKVVIAAHPYCACTWIPVTDSNKKGGAGKGKSKGKDNTTSQEATSSKTKFIHSIAKWATGAGIAVISTTAMYQAFKNGIGNTKAIVSAVVKNNEEAVDIAKSVIKEQTKEQIQDKTTEVVEKIDEAIKPVAPPVVNIPVNIPLPKKPAELPEAEEIMLTALEEKEFLAARAKAFDVADRTPVEEGSKETVAKAVAKVSEDIQDTTHGEIVATANLKATDLEDIAKELLASPTTPQQVTDYIRKINKLSKQIDYLSTGQGVLGEQVNQLMGVYYSTYEKLRNQLIAEGYPEGNVIDKLLEVNPVLKRIDNEAEDLGKHIAKLNQQEAIQGELQTIYNRATKDPSFRRAYLDNKSVRDNATSLYQEMSKGGKTSVASQISRKTTRLKPIEQLLNQEAPLTPDQLYRAIQEIQASKKFVTSNLSNISKRGVNTELLGDLAKSQEMRRVAANPEGKAVRTAAQKLPVYKNRLVSLNSELDRVEKALLDKATSTINPAIKKRTTTEKLGTLLQQYHNPAIRPRTKMRIQGQLVDLRRKARGDQNFSLARGKELAGFSQPVQYKKLIGLRKKYVSLGRFR